LERDSHLIEQIECLLFVAAEPVDVSALCHACECSDDDVRAALAGLHDRLAASGGLQLVEIAGGYQLSTKPDHSDAIARFLNPRRRRLSRAILETLAVVAYRQPITMAEIEAVRGVNSDYSVRTLVELNLLEAVGRKETPGRPVIYGTTGDFLHQFNLRALDDLPPIELEVEA